MHLRLQNTRETYTSQISTLNGYDNHTTKHNPHLCGNHWNLVPSQFEKENLGLESRLKIPDLKNPLPICLT
jgi:hypothetical protein